MSLIFRASSIHRLMGSAKSIDESLLTDEIKEIQKKTNAKRTDDDKLVLAKALEQTLSAGAKTLVKEMLRKEKHKAPSKFAGSKETAKGHAVEDDAIKFLMQQEFISAEKNTTRFTNDWVTGEPDVITNDRVIDTKCPYTYWSMPYYKCEIEEKSTTAGYDWQQLTYLWLLRDNDSHEPVFLELAELKYILMPTPSEQVTRYDDDYLHTEYVENMNPVDRISTYPIVYDQGKIEQIKVKILAARKYAETMVL